eukprot:Amastigsp_a676426_198.p4 type:complete len:110 gc:universal Amastigsp_a676426_198:1889-2218(+)
MVQRERGHDNNATAFVEAAVQRPPAASRVVLAGIHENSCVDVGARETIETVESQQLSDDLRSRVLGEIGVSQQREVCEIRHRLCFQLECLPKKLGISIARPVEVAQKQC